MVTSSMLDFKRMAPSVKRVGLRQVSGMAQGRCRLILAQEKSCHRVKMISSTTSSLPMMA